MKTLFGWVVQGPTTASCQLTTSEAEEITANSVNLILESDRETKIRDRLTAFWEIESLGLIESGKKEIIVKHEEAVQRFENTIEKRNDRYQVRLPWAEDKPQLANNFHMAQKRLRSLTLRFRKDINLFENYRKVIKDYEQKGKIERVPHGDIAQGPMYYIPHQPVVKQERMTTKVRVVFDASSHEKNETSLNECLLPGPNLNPELFEILLKFRMKRVAITSDIEQAFLQISIAPEDRNATRFLWNPNIWNQHPGEEFITYRMTRVLFGVTSSPYHLAATIKYHIKGYESKYPETCQLLNNDLYVDDFISGDEDHEVAYQRASEARQILSEAKLKLRKWQTNSVELRKRIKEENWDDQPIAESNIQFASPKFQKVLGMTWNPLEDNFTFEIESLIKDLASFKDTKRCVLQSAARIFDPLGLVTPFTVRVKILFQQVWVAGLDWDDMLPEELAKTWKNWRSELPDLRKITTPRHCLSNLKEVDVIEKELHCFCDSSEAAYGAVLYSRVKMSNGKVDTHLITSKSRVAPLKKMTLPRLELMGALIGARLTQKVNKIFKAPRENMYLWSDSSVVIHWIQGLTRKWKPFVANRVEEIQGLTEPRAWNHCPGKENPADMLTRGERLTDLVEKEAWWKRPNWLKKHREEWPTKRIEQITPREINEIEINQEIRRVYLENAKVAINVAPEELELESRILLKNYSSLKFPVRVFAWMKRFITNARKNAERNKEPLSAEEVQASKNYFIRRTQLSAFAEELKNLKEKKSDQKLFPNNGAQPLSRSGGHPKSWWSSSKISGSRL